MSETYYSNVNPELLGWLPLNAKRVLELGCGEGALAASYRHRNPAVYYTAAEVHAPSAAVARTRVDRLIEGDIEAVSDEEIAEGGLFDAAVMGDVLEHLSDPWRTLRRLHMLLNENGHLILCVPNISHWLGLAELLSGRWPSHDSGLFDRTHLRFFTADSLTTILRECGFEVLKSRPRNVVLNRPAAERFIPVLADAAERLGIDRRAFIERANALQYVLVARKVDLNKPSQLLRIHVGAMAPRFLDVRTKLPAEGLNSLPDLIVTFAEKTLQLPSYSANVPKVCVLQRLSVSDELSYWKWLRDRVAEGWVFVGESDDHPALMAAVHGRDPAKESWLSITGVHAVQTSTPALAEAYKEHNPQVGVFPNSVFNIPDFIQRSGPLRIFLGALNRERITAKVAQSLADFCIAHPECEFVVVHDRAFFDGLATTNKTFYPAAEYETYLSLMAGCHVALMPLEGTFGETFESDVKFLEAASRSVISIASPTVYSHTIINGETGMIAEKMCDWSIILEKLVSDISLQQRLARSAWSYVRRERMFSAQVESRRAWYLSVWERREELSAALLSRQPTITKV